MCISSKQTGVEGGGPGHSLDLVKCKTFYCKTTVVGRIQLSSFTGVGPGGIHVSLYATGIRTLLFSANNYCLPFLNNVDKNRGRNGGQYPCVFFSFRGFQSYFTYLLFQHIYNTGKYDQTDRTVTINASTQQVLGNIM